MNKFIKSILLSFLVLFIFIGISAPIVLASETVSFRWDRNVEPDLAKYTIYWRIPGGDFVRNETAPFFHQDIDILVVDSIIMDEHPNEVTVTAENVGNEFVMTAMDTSNMESDYSNQVDTIKPTPPQNFSIWQIILAFFKRILFWFA